MSVISTIEQLEATRAELASAHRDAGVLAERHRLRPREAFDLLRKASRARGARVTELAQDVDRVIGRPLRLAAGLAHDDCELIEHLG